MTTTLDTRIAAVSRTEGSRMSFGRLLAPLGGLGIVAGLIALMVSPASDDTGETPAEVVAYASSHEGWNIAILLFGLASVALGGMFTAGLYTRLRPAATETQAVLVLIGGIVFALCLALCWILWMAPLVDMPDEPARAIAQAEAYLGYDDVGWFLLGTAGVAAALMIVPASLAAIRSGLPAWLGWLGVAAGLASLGTVAFLGMFAWMAWIAVASLLLRGRKRDFA
jgi:hypothetical protein